MIEIPSHLWKIVMYDGKLEAYLFPKNTPQGFDFKSGKTTLDNIEKYSNLELSFLDNYYQKSIQPK